MNNGYECFEELRLGLVRLGQDASAKELANSLSGGATGSEVLGLVSESLRRIRANRPDLCSGALASDFGACVRAVQIAWPGFK